MTWSTRSVALAAVLSVGCGGDGDKDSGTDSGSTTPTTPTTGWTGPSDEQLAADLWAEIQGFDTWGQFPGWTAEPLLSGDHTGNFVVAYYNDPLLGWSLTGMAPEGSIAVKEEYNPTWGASTGAGSTAPATGAEPDPFSIVVMKKLAGYDALTNDWFWANYTPDGSVLGAGKLVTCSGCHRAAPTTDYVFTTVPI